jgi:hypothetical protein
VRARLPAISTATAAAATSSAALAATATSAVSAAAAEAAAPATTTTAAAEAATPTATAAAAGALARDVDRNLTPIEHRAVEALDCFLTRARRCELDEPESSRLTRHAVENDARRNDLSEFREGFAKLLVHGGIGEITYVEPVAHFRLPLNTLSARIGFLSAKRAAQIAFSDAPGTARERPAHRNDVERKEPNRRRF